MSNRREFPLLRLLLSFILATATFIIILLIASGVSYYNYQKISSQNNEIIEYLNQIDILLNMSVADCGEDILIKSSKILDEVGGKLSLLETRFKKNDPRVLEQKKLYSEIELKHLSIIKQIEKLCQKNYTKIIFFYSNYKSLEEESSRMGFILRAFKNKNPEQIMIYSFDYNLDSETIQNLKKEYNITSAPIIVINDQNKLYVKNLRELDIYLNPSQDADIIRVN